MGFDTYTQGIKDFHKCWTGSLAKRRLCLGPVSVINCTPLSALSFWVSLFPGKRGYNSILSECERTKEAEGGVRLDRSLKQGADSMNIKRLLLIKESQVFKIRNFAPFYVWEDARAWVYWNHSFHVRLSQLGLVSSHSPSSSVLYAGSGGSWRAAREQTLFLLGTIYAQKFICGGPESLMAVTALLVDMTGTIPFLTCQISKQRILQSSSHYSHPRWWTLRELRLETGHPLPSPQPLQPLPVLHPQAGSE